MTKKMVNLNVKNVISMGFSKMAHMSVQIAIMSDMKNVQINQLIKKSNLTFV